jgi:hypothetical protein
VNKLENSGSPFSGPYGQGVETTWNNNKQLDFFALSRQHLTPVNLAAKWEIEIQKEQGDIKARQAT